jgi:hypothetical protein
LSPIVCELVRRGKHAKPGGKDDRAHHDRSLCQPTRS